MDTVDQIILLTIREMTERRKWCCPTEVHRVIGLAGVHVAEKPALESELDAQRMKTFKRLARMMKERLIREIELFEYGQLWEHLRLTNKAHGMIKGMKAPDEIRQELKPVFIDFAQLDFELAGGHATEEKKEFVPIHRRKVKVQSKPHWNSGGGYEPIRWLHESK